MLDTGQPGELPLMRELVALHQARSWRNPSTTKSPMSGDFDCKSPLRKYVGKNGEPDGVVGRSQLAGKRVWRREIPTRTLLWSESVHDSDGQGSWDLGIEGTLNEDIEEQKEVFGGLWKQGSYPTSQDKKELKYKHARDLYDDGISLRNWTSSNQAHQDTIEWDHNQNKGERHTKHTDVGIKGRVLAHSKEPKGEHGTRKLPVNNQSKLLRKQPAGKLNPQVLSPLVLNSPDDFHYTSHPLSFFSLEGPLSSNQQELSSQGVKLSVRNEHHGSSSAASRAPFPHVKHVGSSVVQEAAKRSWRSQDLLTSSSSTSQRTVSQGSFPGAWELPLNDELDVSELPSSRCGIPCYWSKSKRHGKKVCDSSEKDLPSTCPDLSRQSGRVSLKVNMGMQRASSGFMSSRPSPSMASDDGAVFSVESSASLSSTANGDGRVPEGLKRQPSSVTCDAGVDPSAVEGKELAVFVGRPRCLSQKYRPRSFEELLGQNLVGHTLSNAIAKGKIAPVYLFQGPRGTGKTSAARIFAAALNCRGERKPCGICGECISLASGKNPDVREVDAASHNGIERVKALTQHMFSSPSVSLYKVFIIDECHMLTNETWNGLLKLLEEPPGNAVFILITTDPGKLPQTTVSRCQKFHFQKLKHSDIVRRLNNLVELENLDVEMGALDLIASKSDGSLRDAETTIDQLSLCGQKITVNMVHELVGSVSDEKLLSLLDLALCSDTVSTVRRARELIDSGVEPLDLMSQLATLITDILAGSHEPINKSQKGGFFSRNKLSEEDLERLRAALTILSEAEKQLRSTSNDRTTWLTAALLQFGPDRPLKLVISSNSTSVSASPATRFGSSNRPMGRSKGPKFRKESRKKSPLKGMGPNLEKRTSVSSSKGKYVPMKSAFEARVHPMDQSRDIFNELSAESDSLLSNDGAGRHPMFMSPGNLGSIWLGVLEGCKSIPLRQLLRSHGKLISISFSEVNAVAHLEFGKPEHKARAERHRKSICNAFKRVLGHSVEVKISLSSLTIGMEGIVSRLFPSASQTPRMHGAFVQSADSDRTEQGFQSEIEVGSLRYWRSQNGVALPNSMEIANSTFSLPTRSSNHGLAGGFESIHRVEKTAPEKEKAESSWAHVTHKYSPLRTFDGQQFKALRGPQIVGRHQEILANDSYVFGARLEQSTDGGLLSPNYVHPSYVPNYGMEGRLHACNPEEENMRLESRLKYGGLLCWKAPQTEDQKTAKPRRRRKCCILIRLVPCPSKKQR